MKLFTATFFTASFISFRTLMAQDASAVPIPDTTPAPSGQPAAAPLFPGENPPPIVDKPRHGGGGTEGEPVQNPPVKKSKTAESTESIADNIKYREAKTKALRDEKVEQALADVDAAKTDQEKRAALKRYYTALAGKILKIDGSIKKLVDARLKDSLKQLDQSKVRPEEYPQQASTVH